MRRLPRCVPRLRHEIIAAQHVEDTVELDAVARMVPKASGSYVPRPGYATNAAVGYSFVGRQGYVCGSNTTPGRTGAKLQAAPTSAG